MCDTTYDKKSKYMLNKEQRVEELEEEEEKFDKC